VGLTTTRSPSGVSLVAVLVAVAKVFPPGDGTPSPQGMAGPSEPVNRRSAPDRCARGQPPRWCRSDRFASAPPETSRGASGAFETVSFSTLGVRVLAIL